MKTSADETEAGSTPRIITFVDYCVRWFFWPSVVVLVVLLLFMGARVSVLKHQCWWADIIAGILSICVLMSAVLALTKAWAKSASASVAPPTNSPSIIATRGIFILSIVAFLLAFIYTIALKVKYPSLTQRGVSAMHLER